MNCRHVEEIIPLYVGGDLESAIADRVSAHLMTCQACERLAGQYRESQDWVRENAAPPFDDEFFEGVRSGVMAEISMERSRPTLSRRIALSWRWDLAIAAAALILVIVGLAFYTNHGHPSSPLPSNAGGDSLATPNTGPGDKDKPTEDQVAKNSNSGVRKGLRDAIKKAIEPAPSELLIEAAAPTMGEGNPEDERQQEGVTDLLPSFEITDSTAQSPPVEKTRIEIQTSDPTIRIIWFAPKTGNAESTRHSTDT